MNNSTKAGAKGEPNAQTAQNNEQALNEFFLQNPASDIRLAHANYLVDPSNNLFGNVNEGIQPLDTAFFDQSSITHGSRSEPSFLSTNLPVNFTPNDNGNNSNPLNRTSVYQTVPDFPPVTFTPIAPHIHASQTSMNNSMQSYYFQMTKERLNNELREYSNLPLQKNSNDTNTNAP
ncbi:hypothetical protein BC833DRAFT_658244, partial [Globomyces pollinis-pini]